MMVVGTNLIVNTKVKVTGNNPMPTTGQPDTQNMVECYSAMKRNEHWPTLQCLMSPKNIKWKKPDAK